MGYDNLILIFTAIIYEALPFIVLGVVIAGLLEEFVPQQALARVFPRNRTLAIALGCILGLVFPMCECGIIVVMKRLLRKGLPLSVCVAYVLAGPIINVVVILSTYVAFNPPDPKDYVFGGPENVVLLRVGLGYVTALITALVVDRLERSVGTFALLHPSVTKGLTEPTEGEEDIVLPTISIRWVLRAAVWLLLAGPLRVLLVGAYRALRGDPVWLKRFDNITKTALNDFVDIMAFVVLGAACAAGGRLLLQQTQLETVIQDNIAVAILLMMALAILFCLCSEADAFVAANFAAYWPPASKLAFLVLGPMLDMKLYLMYTRVFRSRLIFTIIGCVCSQVFLYTLAVHYAAPYGPYVWAYFRALLHAGPITD